MVAQPPKNVVIVHSTPTPSTILIGYIYIYIYISLNSLYLSHSVEWRPKQGLFSFSLPLPLALLRSLIFFQFSLTLPLKLQWFFCFPPSIQTIQGDCNNVLLSGKDCFHILSHTFSLFQGFYSFLQFYCILLWECVGLKLNLGVCKFYTCTKY
jgi:hypothetical protein